MASLLPNGIHVDVVGIDIGDRGRSCEAHEVCGSQLEVGKTVLRIREVTINKNGVDEPALAAYTHSLEDGLDGCRVGFLRKHLIPHKDSYVNKCLLVSKIYSEESSCPSDRQKHYRNHGCCRASMLYEAKEEAVSPLKMGSPNPDDLLNYLIQLGEDDVTPEQDKKKRKNVPVTTSPEAKKKQAKHAKKST